MLYLGLEVCDTPNILRIISLFKTTIGALSIAVPVILIVSMMIQIVKSIIKGEPELLSKVRIDAGKRCLAALLVFLVPTLVNLLLDVLGTGSKYYECYENANSTYIAYADSLQEAEDALKKAKDEAENERLAKIYEERKAALEKEQAIQAENRKKAAASSSSGGVVDTGGTGGTPSVDISTTNIVDINVTDLQVPLIYSDHVSLRKTLGFNADIATQAHTILYNVSGYVKANPTLIPQFETAGAYVGKTGYHGKGQAIDLFNQWSYTSPSTGKTYSPYTYQGTAVWNEYKRFICDVCGGVENCEYNINYQIFVKYFKPYGWCWGGNWGPDKFDPMHYEYKGSDGACYTSNKAAIKCS